MISQALRHFTVLFGAAATATMVSTAALAGTIADKAAEAEEFLTAGKTAEAFQAMDAAVAALWQAAPLIIADAFLIEDNGLNRRTNNTFGSGEPLRIQVVPLGYGLEKTDGHFEIALTTSIEIRTPAGLILGKSDDFGRLKWSGPLPNRRFSGRVGVDLPELKPGDYEVLLTLSDATTGETASTTLPITITAVE